MSWLSKTWHKVTRGARSAVGLYKKPEEIAPMPVNAPELDLLKPEMGEEESNKERSEKKKRRRGKSALKVDSAGGTGLDIGSGGSGRNIV